MSTRFRPEPLPSGFSVVRHDPLPDGFEIEHPEIATGFEEAARARRSIDPNTTARAIEATPQAAPNASKIEKTTARLDRRSLARQHDATARRVQAGKEAFDRDAQTQSEIDRLASSGIRSENYGISTGKIAGMADDEARRRLDSAHAKINADRQSGDSWATTLKKTVQNLDDQIIGQGGGGLVESLPQTLRYLAAVAGNPSGLLTPETDAERSVSQAGRGMYQRATRELQRNAVQTNDPSKKFASDLVSGATSMLTALGVTAVTKNPEAGIAVLSAQAFGSQYGQSIEQGRSKQAAFVDASWMAAAEALGENKVIGEILKPGQTFAKRVVNSALGEAMQEGFTGTLQHGYEAGVLDPTMTISDVIRATAYDALLGGAVGGGSASLVGGGSALRERFRPVNAPGVIETATQSSQATPEDIASPLSRVVDLGAAKTLVAGARGKLEADSILTRNSAPATGSMVEVMGKRWTVEDAFTDDEGQDGVTLSRDGKKQKIYFGDLADAGIGLTTIADPRGSLDEAVAAAAPGTNLPIPTAPREQAGPVSSREQLKARIRRAENNTGDINAKNPKSSASGIYQFTDATFDAYYRKVYGTAPPAGVKNDTAVQEKLMDSMTSENEARLKKAGFETTAGNLYLAHFAGPQGAINLLRNPNGSAAAILGPRATASNRSIVEGKTGAEVAAWAARKMGGSVTSPTALGTPRFSDGTAAEPENDHEFSFLHDGEEAATPAAQQAMPEAGDQPLIQPEAAPAPSLDYDKASKALEEEYRAKNVETAESYADVQKPFHGMETAEKAALSYNRSSSLSPDPETLQRGIEFALEGGRQDIADVMVARARQYADDLTSRAAELPGNTRMVELANEAKATAERMDALANPVKGDGSRVAPLEVRTAADLERAAERVNTAPTEAEKEAGNYEKSHIKVQGIDITIENPKGSERSGVDPDGKAWSVTMPSAYGYAKRTVGQDDEQVDIYVGDNPESDRVFVIDQVHADTKAPDEHKAMIGFPSEEAAQAAYHDAFSDGRGPDRIGAVTEMPVTEFKSWLKNGDTTKPIAPAAGAIARGDGEQSPSPTVTEESPAIPAATTRIDSPAVANVKPDSVSDFIIGPVSVPENGDPGYSIHQYPGDPIATAVFRDDTGKARGGVLVPLTDEAKQNFGGVISYVDPAFRRQGVATKLYDLAREKGLPIDDQTGKGDLTPDGAAFVNARRGVKEVAPQSEAPETVNPIPPIAENAPAFDPEAFVGKLRSYIASGTGTLNDIGKVAKALDLPVEQAHVVMGAVASRPGAGFRATKGRPAVYRTVQAGGGRTRKVLVTKAVPPRYLRDAKSDAPKSVMAFVRGLGGINDPRHDLRNVGGLRNHPGVISSKGRSVDEIGRALWEDGRFAGKDPSDPDQRPTEAETLELLDRESQGKRAAPQSSAPSEEEARASAGDAIKVALQESGGLLPAIVSNTEREAIIDEMLATGDDAASAAYSYFERKFTETVLDAKEQTADDSYDIPFELGASDEAFPNSRDDGAVSSEDRGRPASEARDEGGSHAAGADRGADGGQAGQLDAFGTRQGDQRTALERKGEGRSQSDKAQKSPGSDGGLFDSGASQGTDLFDTPSKAPASSSAPAAAPNAKPVEPEAKPDISAELQAELPDGYRIVEGRGLLGKGKWGVRRPDGALVWNLHDTQREAVSTALSRLEEESAAVSRAADRTARVADLGRRLLAGEVPTDADIKLLDLKPNAFFSYLSPAVQEVLGVSRAKVREAMGDALKLGYSDMGAKLWSGNSKKALMNAAAFVNAQKSDPIGQAKAALQQAMDALNAASEPSTATESDAPAPETAQEPTAPEEDQQAAESIRDRPAEISNEDFPAIRDELQATMERLGIADRVLLRTVERMDKANSHGSYWRKVITVALNSSDPIHTINHEAIHALRALNVFLPAEWTALVKAARADTGLWDSIQRRYAGRNLNTLQMEEEAVADMFGNWSAAREAKGFIGRAFQRVTDLLKTIVAAFDRVTTGNRQPGQIFRNIESGQVGRRGQEVRAIEPVEDGIPLYSIGEDAESRATLSGILNRTQEATGTLKSTTTVDQALTAADNIRTAIQDRMLPMLRTETAVEQMIGRTLTDREKPYLQEELMTGRVGAALERLTGDLVEPLFESMSEEKVGADELESYLYARHAPERNARIAKINPEFSEGEGSGMTDIEAAAIMARIKKAGRMEALERLAEKVDAIRDFAVAYRVESGLMSQAQADEWKSVYQNYTPLRGFAESEERIADSKGISVRGKESQRAFGRRSRAEDLIAHTIMQAEEAIARGEKNRVGQAFYALAKEAKDKEFWQTHKVKVERVQNPETGLVERRVVTDLSPGEEQFTVFLKVDGEAKRVTMNPADPAARRLAGAMRRLDDTKMNGLVKFGSTVNRFLSTVNTSLNPEFVITNAFRDIQTAMANLSGVDVKGIQTGVIKDYIPAMKASLEGSFDKSKGEWGQWWEEFRDAGGRVYYNQMRDIPELRKEIEKRMQDIARKSNRKASPAELARLAKAGFTGTLGFIEKVNLGVENAIRLAAYKQGREKGLSKDQAASLAKNLTVNFNRRGSWGVALNASYLFFNASVQGSTRILLALKHRRVRRLAYGMVLSGLMLDMLNRIIGDDDDDGEAFYDKISDFEKSRNLIVMLNKGKYLKIPLPYGFNVFYSVGRSMSELGHGKRFGTVFGHLATTALDAFNPIGGSDGLANVIAPTLLDPVIDLAVDNRDFSGRPIMPDQPQYGTPVPNNQRYWNSVSPHSKAVTDFLNRVSGGDKVVPGSIDVSPEVLDYLGATFFGATGAFLLRTAGMIEKTGEMAAGNPDVEFDKNDFPLVRKVVGDKPGFYDKAAFYARLDSIDQVTHNLKLYKENGDRTGYVAYRDREADVLQAAREAKHARKAIRDIRKEKRRIDKAKELGRIADPDYNARAKLLKERETTVVSRFNGAYLSLVKDPVGAE